MESKYKVIVLVDADNEYDARDILHQGDIDRMSIEGVERLRC